MDYPLPEDKIEKPAVEKRESPVLKFGRVALSNMIVGDIIPNFGVVLEITEKHIVLKDGSKKKKYKINSPDYNALAYLVGGLISMAIHLSPSQVGSCMDAFKRDEKSEIVDGVVRIKDE